MRKLLTIAKDITLLPLYMLFLMAIIIALVVEDD